MRRNLLAAAALAIVALAFAPAARADVAPNPPPTGDVKCNGAAGGACTVGSLKGTCKEYKCTRSEPFACFYCTASTGEIIEEVADGTSVANPDGSPAKIAKPGGYNGSSSSGGGGCSATPHGARAAAPWLLALAVPAVVLRRSARVRRARR